MKILYVASAIVAPGSHGGATHVVEVSRELAKLGHEIHVICARPNRKEATRITLGVEGGSPIEFYRHSLPKFTAIALYPLVKKLAKALKPDLIMERYYNFAGSGMLFASRHHLPSLLEVNALILDPLSSPKRRLDRAVFFNRLKWWSEKQCFWATRIITPLHTTIPAAIPREKIIELPWGANVDMFNPTRIKPSEQIRLRQELGIPEKAHVLAFAGSFRHWHGVEVLLEAAKLAIPQDKDLFILMLGGGPLFEHIQKEVVDSGLTERVILTGAISYQKMPLYLSLAHAGVAPFDTSKHAPLREAGFYWSPLKIFEYMALALPSIVPDFRPLNEIIRQGQEGLLFREGAAKDLARAILELLSPDNILERERMGVSARNRVVESFSWRSHCLCLDEVIKQLV
ncbi:MAG: glycosyltransferase family 4 protein [Chloroflexi bacterium]|uniref:Glycosyltransferase family 4 protein n=1 Tax=Candidatus Chlorohelix allophototropha TaxID=3003348 RepID=A0A8T7LVR1_9CHLR|nr:glycosyltransferase family 4 protein [Chloroflexota bacterium]WJW66139.1 glycosyltransferase family 4 protein [Chloroflexota bacterium L227-S17]